MCVVAGDEQRTKLDTVRERIQGLQSTIRSTSGERSALSDQLQQAEQYINRQARKLRLLEERLSRQRQRLETLRGEQRAQSQELVQQRATLASQVRAAYAMGRQERVKILLNQQDPVTVGRVMAYYDYLGRARAEKMRTIQEQLQRKARTEREIAAGERALVALRDQQSQELAGLKKSQHTRRGLVAKLTRELNDQGRRLKRLQRDERELEKLINDIEVTLADIPLDATQQQAFVDRRGRLPWPAGGRIAHRFGAPRLGGMVWDGVMISAPEGREVRAVHHGRVAFADWLRGFGLLLIVDHGDGYMSLYGHNQSLFKEPGDWVDSNEPMALIGNSGGRDMPGVYFGIRHKGRAIDPAKWCKRPDGRNVG